VCLGDVVLRIQSRWPNFRWLYFTCGWLAGCGCPVLFVWLFCLWVVLLFCFCVLAGTPIAVSGKAQDRPHVKVPLIKAAMHGLTMSVIPCLLGINSLGNRLVRLPLQFASFMLPLYACMHSFFVPVLAGTFIAVN